MILFLSDFGDAGPYVGQVHAVLARRAPGVPVIDLMHDLPAFRPAAAGCLIQAILRSFPDSEPGATAGLDGGAGDVVLAVVDPGVGTARAAIIVEAGGIRYVGPDNGLFAGALSAADARAWRIAWRPAQLSDSFHGRDLFAPVAAMLAMGQSAARNPVAIDDLVRRESPEPLAEVIYCDRYGNAMTGIDASALGLGASLDCGGRRFRQARTFGDVPTGTGFWYANSLGLAEIAVNRGSAATMFRLTVGMPVGIADASAGSV